MEIMRTVYSNRRDWYNVTYTPDIVYAHRAAGDLRLQLLTPVEPDKEPDSSHPLYRKMELEGKRPVPARDPRVFPLIVDIPGSGWSGAEGYRHIPLLTDFARAGFAVACIGYRGTFKDDVRFPAAVQDAKEAVRFLRAEAYRYHIDPEHVCILGDSSGGHTAAFAALTGDDPLFTIGEHTEQSSDVNAVALFYAPNDFIHLVEDRLAEGKKLRPGEGSYPFEAREMYQDDFLRDPEGMLKAASATSYITPDKKLPPLIFLNGDDDPIIPLRQGLRFCEKWRECGGRAEFVKIAGGLHGTGCFTEETMKLLLQFFRQYN